MPMLARPASDYIESIHSYCIIFWLHEGLYINNCYVYRKLHKSLNVNKAHMLLQSFVNLYMETIASHGLCYQRGNEL